MLPSTNPENTDNEGLTERSLFEGFAEYVREKQREWTVLRKPFREDVTQSLIEREIPGLVSTLCRYFPSYIPDTLRDLIAKTHPDPILTSYWILDQRFLNTTPLSITTPKELQSREEKWSKGTELLNEIATDKLANDIIQQVLQESIPTNIPLASTIQKTLTRVLGYKYRTISHPIDESYIRLSSFLGSKEVVERFLPFLVRAMITGDTNPLQNFLSPYHKTFEDLTVYIGDGTGNKEAWIRLEKQLEKVVPNQLLPQTTELITRLLPTIFAGAFVAKNYPGVISVNLKLIPDQLLTLLNLHISFVAMYVIIHEMCHYFSQDKNRSGFQEFHEEHHPSIPSAPFRKT